MFTIGKGFADEITLINGKKQYTGVQSLKSTFAKKNGLQVRTVSFEGCCIASNINDRAHDRQKFPISINGVDIYTFIEEVAKPVICYEDSNE